ncbi:MAG: cell division protein ZapA [Gammaproteobacteria bacterium]|nr:cell division protein ZapA [Gammaproteobacteria bacterium]
MSSEPVPTSIRILEKEYVISCPEDEQAELQESAAYLNERMLEAREGGKALGTERIAVMAALNIIHDHLRLVRDSEDTHSSLDESIRRISDRIDTSLSRRPSNDELD